MIKYHETGNIRIAGGFSTMNLPLISHIKDIKYKGFHPIEKKKTIDKINLLIDKYNTFYHNFFQDNSDFSVKDQIYAKYGGYEELLEVLKTYGLEAYYQMGISYVHENQYNITKRMDQVEKDLRDDFEKSLEKLKNSGKDLKTINQNVERNEFWKIYSVVGENSLKIKNPEYQTLKDKIENLLKKEIRECNVIMVGIFQTYLIRKEKEKLNETSNFLKATILGLENEIYKNESLKEEMEKVIEALRKIIEAMDPNKSVNLSRDQLKLLSESFKGIRNFENMKNINTGNLEGKYYLSSIKSNKRTKKMIFIIISVLTDSANKRNLRKIITRNVEERVKNANATNQNESTKN